ncbi:metal-dependent transcriptional regulator [uncultured Desulfobacter sp.]|uniref:metal-dependent transcriptional regulator n=1 Tax=uncultured Desulfobacter sp. TaxID=240139 RepID=UPI0029C60A82|nr:metal-dependent transcriptional regulator [uncultured Desulfobacter sp.]
MNSEHNLSESLEDYLEAILELQTMNTVARSKDIAAKLNIKCGSVTGTLKKLADRKLINYEPYGYITLTPKGDKIAKEVTTRHNVFKHFLFKHVEFDEDTAEQTACRMEHAMNHEHFMKFKAFVTKLDA